MRHAHACPAPRRAAFACAEGPRLVGSVRCSGRVKCATAYSAADIPSVAGSSAGTSYSNDGEYGQGSVGEGVLRRVAIFVEPSPFSHVSGMKNRFENLIRELRKAGDEVMVVTPDPKPPKDFCGARVVNVLGFKLPFYQAPTLLLSLGISVRVLWYLLRQRPHVIHVSTPGILCFAAVLYAKLLATPLVMSYHTHIPEYIPQYTWKGLVQPMWSIIRWCTRQADLTLVTSLAMKDELTKNRCRATTLDVWQKAVDSEIFNPRFRSSAMKSRMSDGNPDAPLLVYVGRLGAEKNLKVLKEVIIANPGCRLAFVGDGPTKVELETYFKDLPVKFLGMMRGIDLSEAYASADIFVMPSESETLGFVVLEAMASGVPVVCVAAGGLTDIISQPGVTGMLYAAGNIAEASECVKQLIVNEPLRAQIGAAGLQEVNKWGWTAAVQKMRGQQYDRAIKFHRSKRRFGWLALRVGVGRLLQRTFRFLMNTSRSVWGMLDYAKKFRSTTLRY